MVICMGSSQSQLISQLFYVNPKKTKLMLLLNMRRTEISIPTGLQEKMHWGKPKLMALLGHGENWQRQSLSSFRETKFSITPL